MKKLYENNPNSNPNRKRKKGSVEHEHGARPENPAPQPGQTIPDIYAPDPYGLRRGTILTGYAPDPAAPKARPLTLAEELWPDETMGEDFMRQKREEEERRARAAAEAASRAAEVERAVFASLTPETRIPKFNGTILTGPDPEYVAPTSQTHRLVPLGQLLKRNPAYAGLESALRGKGSTETASATGPKTGLLEDLTSAAKQGRDRLFDALAPKEAKAEAWKQESAPLDGVKSDVNMSDPKEAKLQETETKGGSFFQNYNRSKLNAAPFEFMDVKLATIEQLTTWETRYPDYRTVINTVLDEPLGKFSAKVGGHKTLREFFAAASLNDDEMILTTLGLIRLESDGNPECVTNKAYGLMQVTPIAAKEVGMAHDDTLLTVEPNLRAGLRYLARSTYLAGDRQNYNIAHGVGGYVSGPAAARDKIPAGPVTTREVLVVMALLGRLEELRGRLGHPLGDELLGYCLASPQEREESSSGCKINNST